MKVRLNLFFLAFFLFSSTFTYSQTNIIWFKAKNDVVFQSPTWLELSHSLSLKDLKKALPSSTNPELSKIYEMYCDCSVDDFKKATKNISEDIYSIERGPTYQPLYLPNDLNNPAISDYALYLINAPQAWDLTHGDTNVIIAVSDQDYYEQTTDLVGGVTYHYDTTINITQTHGTAVAITVSGNTDNGYGLSSIGFNTSLALYKMTFNDVLLASQNGSDVINISWSSGCFYSQLQQDVINQAVLNGSIIVSAAGNGTTCGIGTALVYPASYDNVISITSVGPTNNHEKIIGDPSSSHQHNDSVDIATPGYDVSINPAQDWFLNSSGTSFGAAYVSGTIGLMLSVNKCISNADIETILKTTSYFLDTMAINLPYAGLIGAGRIDSYQAVLAAMNMSNPLIPTFTVSNGCSLNDASVVLNVQGGQSPYTASWSNNYSGFNNTALATNTYLVQIVDIHGCVLDTSIYIEDQISAPTNLACYETVAFDTTSCLWVVSGTQAPAPTNLACYDTTVFDTTSCAWIISGTQAPAPTNLSCYETTVFDTSSCLWIVSGTQAPAPILACYETTVFDTTSCAWIISGTQAPAPTNLACYETTVFDQDSCAWIISGDPIINLTIIDTISPYFWPVNGNTYTESGEYEYLSSDCFLEVLNLTISLASLSEFNRNTFSVYPNPNNGNFSINIPSEEIIEIAIFDIYGRKIKNILNPKSDFIQLNLLSGKYIATIHTKDNRMTRIPFIVFL